MKKLFHFAGIFILAATLFSCSNENEPANESQKSSLKLQLNYAKTKAIEGQADGKAPAVISATITLKDAANQPVLQKTLNATELTAINDKSGQGLILEDIPKMATSVEIIANGDITLTDINNYQKLTNGIKDVPYQGTGTITYNASDANSDGHVLKKATVDMSAYLARIEVIGGIPVKENVNGLFAIDVDTIYINNISLKPDSVPTFNAGYLTKQGWQDATVYTASNGTFRNMWDALSGGNTATYENSIGIITNKAAAYHLFPYDPKSTDSVIVREKMQHIVLKVKAYKTAADKIAGTALPNMNYITIRSIIDKATDSRVNKLNRATIYRVDLADLKDYFKPGVTPPIDPEPEAGKVDLAITATLLDWTTVNAKPEL